MEYQHQHQIGYKRLRSDAYEAYDPEAPYYSASSHISAALGIACTTPRNSHGCLHAAFACRLRSLATEIPCIHALVR